MLLCISNTSFHNFKGKTVYKWNIKYLPPTLKKILVVLSEKHTVNVFEKRLSSAFFAISPCGCSRSLKQTKYGADYQKNFFYLFAEKFLELAFAMMWLSKAWNTLPDKIFTNCFRICGIYCRRWQSLCRLRRRRWRRDQNLGNRFTILVTRHRLMEP